MLKSSMMKIGEYEWDPNKDLLSANGASALVYRARNEDAKHVALKIFKDSIVKGDAKANSKRKKLEEQFEMLEKLSHNNIVRHESLLYLETTNQFNQEVECPVLVMEFASEGSLVDYLQKNPTTPHREKLIWDIMEGLKFLHKKGIIHRDLKPENILIMKDAEGLPVGKISDFGISKDTINTGGDSEADKTVGVVPSSGAGTPHFMAPEQFLPKKYGIEGKISRRTDLWALGIIIYWIYQQKLPLYSEEDDYGTIMEIITRDEIDIAGEIPYPYNLVLERCLVKKASERAQSIEQLASIIESVDEDGYWKDIKKNDEISGYLRYVKNFPIGKYRNESLQHIQRQVNDLSSDKKQLSEQLEKAKAKLKSLKRNAVVNMILAAVAAFLIYVVVDLTFLN